MPEPDPELLRRISEGVREEMMDAMLGTLRTAAAACAEICARRLCAMQEEVARAYAEKGDSSDCTSRDAPHAALLVTPSDVTFVDGDYDDEERWLSCETTSAASRGWAKAALAEELLHGKARQSTSTSTLDEEDDPSSLPFQTKRNLFEDQASEYLPSAPPSPGKRTRDQQQPWPNDPVDAAVDAAIPLNQQPRPDDPIDAAVDAATPRDQAAREVSRRDPPSPPTRRRSRSVDDLAGTREEGGIAKKAVCLQDAQGDSAAADRAATAQKKADEGDVECPCLLLALRAGGEVAKGARPEEATLQLPISARAVVHQAARPLRRQGLQVQQQQRSRVLVVGPGAGTGMNGNVYMDLEHGSRLQVEFVGRSHAAYDCYPECWPQGRRAPNLQSFTTSELLATGAVLRSDCIVVGSRGGQVVLPTLWQTLGAAAPPAVVLNGGCAMDMPQPVCWPEAAISFLLLGGRDEMFRRRQGRALTPKEYLAEAQSRVPAQNKTTAILLVSEMEHMPQSRILSAVLRPMIDAVLFWKVTGRAPSHQFGVIRRAMLENDWSGALLYTKDAGIWEEMEVGFGVSSAHQPAALQRAGTAPPMRLAATEAASPAAPGRLSAPTSPPGAAPFRAAAPWPARASAAFQAPLLAKPPSGAAAAPSARVVSGRIAQGLRPAQGVGR